MRGGLESGFSYGKGNMGSRMKLEEPEGKAKPPK